MTRNWWRVITGAIVAAVVAVAGTAAVVTNRFLRREAEREEDEE